jgi:predicted O-methyltransferase YrrM
MKNRLVVERPELPAEGLTARNPMVLLDYLRCYLSDRLKLQQQRQRQHLAQALTPAEARQHLAQIVGDWREGPALVRLRAWAAPMARANDPARAVAARMAGDRSLGELVYGLVRVLRPCAVVETGVATGVTTAHILAALADNAVGRLCSIDLPPTRLVGAGLVGAAVPTELRDRWVFHWGSSRRLLRRILLSEGDSIRLFIHDSDHGYTNMRWELEQAWKVLAPGGWLVADDVDMNTAFADVAGAVGAQPLYVAQRGKPGTFGLLEKPA